MRTARLSLSDGRACATRAEKPGELLQPAKDFGYGRSSVPDLTYRGCRGIPDFVTPSALSLPGKRDTTVAARSNRHPWLPHAAITRSARFTARSSQASFSSPTASTALRKRPGTVERNANRLTIQIWPAPHSAAKLLHRRIVGSSNVSSAVDGLSPTNATLMSHVPSCRERKYRYLRSADSAAAGKFSSRFISRVGQLRFLPLPLRRSARQ